MSHIERPAGLAITKHPAREGSQGAHSAGRDDGGSLRAHNWSLWLAGVQIHIAQIPPTPSGEAQKANDDEGEVDHSRLRLAALGLDEFRHEQVWPLHLDVRRNAACSPVVDTLRSAVFVVTKKLGYLCGTAKMVDKCFVIHAVIKHRVDFNVNTAFVNGAFS